MKKRQFIIIGVAVLILVGGKIISNALSKPQERKAKKPMTDVTSVFTAQVKNDSVAINVQTTGILEAVKRLELYSEVQGVMMPDNGKFKAGNSFQKGEVLLAIRSNDQQAQLYAQRSSFQANLTEVMPDLRIDYPNEFQAWNNYLQSFSNEEVVKPLPKVNSEKLNSFLIGRGIYAAYHSLKNLEIINEKYLIRAPYKGELTTTTVDPGTVIRQGQALGTFIQPLEYELKLSVDAKTANFLNVGQVVKLKSQDSNKEWKGTINRLVKAIEIGSQMNTFFVRVSGDGLKEGMFLLAEIEAQKIPNAFEISRSALVDNTTVYVVKADTLLTQPVTPLYFTENTVVIQGLASGEKVLTKVPPSAFTGMKVNVLKTENY